MSVNKHIPKAIITVGISASGKTTWAKEYARKNDFVVLCRDDIRRSIVENKIWPNYVGQGNLWHFYSFKEMEKQTQELWDYQFSCCTKEKSNIIIADTNLNPKYRIPLIEKLKNLGYDVEIKEFHISFEEAVKRDLKRRDTVGKDVIYKQWQQWIQYLKDTGQKKHYVPDPSLPSAIIVDIDGTVADMAGKRGPFEWDKVGGDEPIPIMFEIIENLVVNSWKVETVIFVSGRDGICYKETLHWLCANLSFNAPFGLLMRKQGDMRKDNIVKEEIFWDKIAPNYNVVAVFDDRPQVVRMWYDVGIPTVFSVGGYGKSCPWVEF